MSFASCVKKDIIKCISKSFLVIIDTFDSSTLFSCSIVFIIISFNKMFLSIVFLNEMSFNVKVKEEFFFILKILVNVSLDIPSIKLSFLLLINLFNDKLTIIELISSSV